MFKPFFCGLVSGLIWKGIVLGAVLSVALGMLWYSPFLFGELWLEAWRPGQSREAAMEDLRLASLLSILHTVFLIWLIERIGFRYAGLSLVVFLWFVLELGILVQGLFVGAPGLAILSDMGYFLAVFAAAVFSLRLFAKPASSCS